jgi:hypothetical protein
MSKISKTVKSVCESIAYGDDGYDPFEKRGDKWINDGRAMYAIANFQPNTKNDKGYPLIFVDDSISSVLKSLIKKQHLQLTDLVAHLPDEKNEPTMIEAVFDLPKGGLVLDRQEIEIFNLIKKDVDIIIFEQNSFTLKMFQKATSADTYGL